MNREPFFMVLTRIIFLTFRSLAGHRWTASLSILGVAIGIASVIIIGSLGESARREVLRNMEVMGSNILIVTAGQVKRVAGRKMRVGPVETLTLQDARAIEEESRLVNQVIPLQAKQIRVKYGSQVTNAAVIGTSPAYRVVKNIEIRSGSFFNEHDLSAMKKVAVLGSQIGEKLFSNEDPEGL